MTAARRAIVLLSGGVDSATALALAKREGFEANALSFDYGQRHIVELDAARRVAEHFEVARHIVVQIDPAVFGGAVLTGGDETPGGPGLPVTYVPARNTLFLSYALAWAEVLGSSDIFMGANADDAAGYPDCREVYLRAFERVAALGTSAGSEVRVHAPLVRMRKREVVDLARSLGVPLELTWSCYFPTGAGEPCGECDPCRSRRRAGLD
jgi:7-cyano-7-deazaguanine synthase